MPIFRFTALAITLGLLSAPYNALAATSNPAFDPKNLMQSEIYHFAQSNPLEDFSSDKNSTLTLSDKRSIMGSQSLLWKWKGGSSFTLHKKLIVPTDKEASKNPLMVILLSILGKSSIQQVRRKRVLK